MKLETFTEEDAQKEPTEFFEEIPLDDIIDVKELPYDDKVRFFRYVLGFNDLVNTNLLTNISLLVLGKDLNEKLFLEKEIAFNSLDEYVDLKFDLVDEIKTYTTDLMKYFLASLRSLAVILPDGKINIPSSYKVILLTLSMRDISKLMFGRVVDFDDDKLLVNDANAIIDAIIGHNPVADEFMKFMMEKISEAPAEEETPAEEE